MSRIQTTSTGTASHKYCLMCGRDNPLSFDLDFKQEDGSSVSADFQANHTLQGYEGIMHGGVLSALCDTAMAQCLMRMNIEAVTGELRVRYIDQVNCNSLLTIRAWVTSSLAPLYHLKCNIHVNGTLVCKAKGKFMQRENSNGQ
jgi:acyl-coenzyme A thioesterase PaaI-like protein